MSHGDHARCRKGVWPFHLYGSNDTAPIAFSETLEGADESAQRLANHDRDIITVVPCMGCRALVGSWDVYPLTNGVPR